MKSQAQRCKLSKVHIHIARQRRLGERMIGDHDKPRRLDLVGSFVLLVTILGYAWHKGLALPWDLL